MYRFQHLDNQWKVFAKNLFWSQNLSFRNPQIWIFYVDFRSEPFCHLFWGRNDNVLISRKKIFLKEYYFLSPFAHWINDRWNFLTGQRIFNLVPLKTVACPPTFNLTVFWFKLRCSYIWFTLALISGWGSSENGRKKSWILIWINTK